MRSIALTVVVALVVASCTETADTTVAEAAIRKVDSEMVAALNARDVSRWLSYLATDARMMPPGMPPVVGTEAIRALITAFLSPQFAVAHHLESVVVSKAADLAYVLYSYELTFKGPAGSPVTEKGKDVSLYRKDSDGSWKLVVDMWSANQTPSGSS